MGRKRIVRWFVARGMGGFVVSRFDMGGDLDGFRREQVADG